MKEKIEYENPEMEIVWLESEDIITESNNDDMSGMMGE